MTSADLLSMLKVDLGITTTAYDTRLGQLLESAQAQIIEEGAADFAPLSSIQDAQLEVMYAAWMWRKRDTMDGMPRMVRYALNNRIFRGKTE